MCVLRSTDSSVPRFNRNWHADTIKWFKFPQCANGIPMIFLLLVTSNILLAEFLCDKRRWVPRITGKILVFKMLTSN